MALKLAKRGEKPAPRAVDLGGGVTLWLRPAEYAESAAAFERITPMMIALRDGSEAAAALGELLGEEFIAAKLDDAQLASAGHKLATMELIELCFDRIEGQLLGDDDVPIVTIDAATAAALLRDSVLARRIHAVIDGPLHEVVAEKNGLAASPVGAAATPDTAPNAALPALPAQEASAD